MQYTPGRPIIFLHIPKTGGLSFKSILLSVFGRNTLYPVHIPKSANYRTLARDFELNGSHLLTGHWDWRAVSALQPANVCVFLRHPIDRLISQYFYFQRIRDAHTAVFYDLINEQNANLQNFFSTPYVHSRLSNVMTHQLAAHTSELGCMTAHEKLRIAKRRLHNCFFVGITDFFESSVSLFFEAIGTPTDRITIPFENASPPNQHKHMREHRESIPKSLYQEDMHLYRYALAIVGQNSAAAL